MARLKMICKIASFAVIKNPILKIYAITVQIGKVNIILKR